MISLLELHNPNSPIKLLSYMDQIKYGWMDKDYKKYYEFDKWWDSYQLLLPNEVAKYKIGTCFEQAIFAYDYLTNMGYVCELIFIQQYKISTHLFVIYKKQTDQTWTYFEHSFNKYKGIYKNFNKPIDIIKLVYSNMSQFSKKYQNRVSTGYKWNFVDRSKITKRLTGPEIYKVFKFDWSKDED